MKRGFRKRFVPACGEAVLYSEAWRHSCSTTSLTTCQSCKMHVHQHVQQQRGTCTLILGTTQLYWAGAWCRSCSQTLRVLSCPSVHTSRGNSNTATQQGGTAPRSFLPVHNPNAVLGLTSYASFMHIARKVALPQPAAAGLGNASSFSLSFVGTHSSRSSGSSKVGSRAPTMLYRCFSPVGSPATSRSRAHLPPAQHEGSYDVCV